MGYYDVVVMWTPDQDQDKTRTTECPKVCSWSF